MIEFPHEVDARSSQMLIDSMPEWLSEMTWWDLLLLWFRVEQAGGSSSSERRRSRRSSGVLLVLMGLHRASTRWLEVDVCFGVLHGLVMERGLIDEEG